MDQKREISDRVTTLEADADSCRDRQKERYEETMSRIRRMEDRYNVLLLLMVGTLLGSLVNIVLSVLKK